MTTLVSGGTQIVVGRVGGKPGPTPSLGFRLPLGDAQYTGHLTDFPKKTTAPSRLPSQGLLPGAGTTRRWETIAKLSFT